MKELNPHEQKLLMKIAVIALEKHYNITESYVIDDSELTENLKSIAPCFVTYKKQGDLRGCIGSMKTDNPLFEEVANKSVQAATEDPRFVAITQDELPNLQREITILANFRNIQDSQEFIPGKHGIILEKEQSHALFLPQVATEQNWDREETLSHLARKAGLSKNAWQKNAVFTVFTAQIVEEKILNTIF